MSDEALIRVEWKLNLIIAALQHNGMLREVLPPLETEHLAGVCPCCRAPLRFSVDPQSETVAMACDCTLPVQAVQGISELLKSPIEDENHVGYRSKSEAHQGQRADSDGSGSSE